MGNRDGRNLDGPETPPDPESFGRALESYRPYLLGVANRELESDLMAKAGASDLVQETFLEAQRGRTGYRGTTEAELRAWLRQILLHNLANFARHYREPKKRRMSREVPIDRETPSGRRPADLEAAGLSPSSYVMRNERDQVVSMALSRLPERDRQVVLWRYQERCRFEEIGRRLGGSPDMARKILDRAIERLRNDVGTD
jgi:RNA polymerase sigma-70 factor (ECF subfamily)